MSRKLSKFEDDITGIALKLVKEKIDPQDAGMDILELVNDELEIETIRERSGYESNDPWLKAFMVLKRVLPSATFDALHEASPDELKTQLATHGASQCDGPESQSDLSGFSMELDEIAQDAMANGTLDGDVVQSLQRIAKELQDYEKSMAGGVGMRFNRLFSGESEDPELQTMLRHAGVMEEEERDLMTILRTLKLVMGPIITDLREIAHWHLRGEPDVQKKIGGIIDQLASFQWKLHGEGERKTSQMWSDVERQKPAY